MRYRIAVLGLLALILVTTIPVRADDLGVTYVNGTIKAITENASGAFDTASSVALQFQSGQVQIAIPYNSIKTYDYKEENRFRLGVLATIGVSLVKARSKRHLITIGWKDESGSAQTATFETTRDRAQGLEKILQARAPQACSGGLPWRRNHD